MIKLFLSKEICAFCDNQERVTFVIITTIYMTNKLVINHRIIAFKVLRQKGFASLSLSLPLSHSAFSRVHRLHFNCHFTPCIVERRGDAERLNAVSESRERERKRGRVPLRVLPSRAMFHILPSFFSLARRSTLINEFIGNSRESMLVLAEPR